MAAALGFGSGLLVCKRLTGDDVITKSDKEGRIDG